MYKNPPGAITEEQVPELTEELELSLTAMLSEIEKLRNAAKPGSDGRYLSLAYTHIETATFFLQQIFDK